MKLNTRASLTTVALTVGAVLRRRGITAVLTSGACASLHTGGAYVSNDADFVVRGAVRQVALDSALGELGFQRQGDRYVHPRVSFYVEFPPGPLAIGSDLTSTQLRSTEGPVRRWFSRRQTRAAIVWRPSITGATARACGWRCRLPVPSRLI